MSLGTISLHALALGILAGLLARGAGHVLGLEVPAVPVGMAVSLVSVVIAGMIQPVPRRRR